MPSFATDFFHTVTGGFFENDTPHPHRYYGGPCHHIKEVDCPNCRPVRQVYIVYCRYCKGRFEDEDYARHYPACIQKHKDDKK